MEWMYDEVISLSLFKISLRRFKVIIDQTVVIWFFNFLIDIILVL